MQPSDQIRSIGHLWVLAVAALGMNAIAGVVAAQSLRQEAPLFEPANVTPSWVERIPLPIQPTGLPASEAFERQSRAEASVIAERAYREPRSAAATSSYTVSSSST